MDQQGESEKLKKVLFRGFTLIEVIVSSVLLMLVFVGLIHLLVSGKRYTDVGRYRMTVTELGKVFLEPLQMDVNQSNWTSSCLGSNTSCPGAQAIDNMTYTLAYKIDNVAGTTLRRVNATISWNESLRFP
jgi:Tfp pilus assembly protein PilV